MNKITRAIVIMCSSFVIFPLACSSSDSGGTVAADKDSFLSQYAAIECGKAQTCCGSPDFDIAACKSAFLKSYPVNPTSVYVPAQGGACLDYRKSLSGSCSTTSTSSGVDSPCKGVFIGTKKAGDPCSSVTDCAPDANGNAWCSGSGGTYGVCQTPVIDAAGRCGTIPSTGGGSVYAVCPSGKICTGSTCIAVPAVGNPCSLNDPYSCGMSLRCDSKTKTCAPPAAAGEACTPSYSGSYSCGSGLRCDDESLVCVAYPGEGQSCPQGTCSQGFTCDYSNQICVAQPGQGQSCSKNQCNSDYFCDNDQICVSRWCRIY